MTGDNVSPFSKNMKFQRMTDDPRIEVLFFSKASKAIETCSFYASTVRRLESVGAAKSRLVTVSFYGANIL